ncbi:hypothetical protein Q5752_002225 [Cryptotrichosporon argae]
MARPKAEPADSSADTGNAEASSSTAPASAPAADADAANAKPNPSPTAPRERKRRLDVNPSLIISEGRSKRRRTPTPEPEPEEREDRHDPKDRARAKELGLKVYNKVMTMKDSNGESMAEPFIQLPSREDFDDYYETIKHPMSLEMVHEKLMGEQYETLKAVCADLGQIWTNAKRYNVRESLIFQYAKKYHKFTRTFYDRETAPRAPVPASTSSPVAAAIVAASVAMADADASGSRDNSLAPPTPGDQDAEGEPDDAADDREASAAADGGDADGVNKSGRKRGSYMKDGPTVYKLLKPVLKAIKELKVEGSDRLASSLFLNLPDSREFIDYYKTIKDPISLSEIEARMIARRYDTTDQFFADIELMVGNAFAYNEDGSDVYRDALQIKELADHHRDEINQGTAQPFLRRAKVAASYAQGTPSRPAPSPLPASVYPYASQASPHQAPATVPYLPQLPPGVVTEEVVASLDRYPAYEQQAWIASLPPLAQSVYQQMQAANLAKKRGVAPPSAPLAPGTPGAPTLPLTPGVSAIEERRPPPMPTISHIDVVFPLSFAPPATSSSPRPTSHPTLIPDSPPTPKFTRSELLRLRNRPGLANHAVLVNATTTDLTLTAFIDTSLPPTARPVAREGTPPASDVVPEVSIRVNGTPGSIGRIIQAERKDRVRAVRWNIAVPTGRMESKVEIVATRPGQMAETSVVWVCRQF